MPGTVVSSSRAFISVNSASNPVRKALLLPHLKKQELSWERTGKHPVATPTTIGSVAVSHPTP